MILLDELENVTFLSDFTPTHRKAIARMAQLKEHSAGSVVFREKSSSPYIYFVLAGEVDLEIRVPDCGDVQVLTVGPGELLGWSPVLGGRPMTATARAATRCRLAALDAARILELAEKDPPFGVEFFRGTSAALAQRLHATRRQIPDPHQGKVHALSEGAD
jgi:CRP/FNR family transcriptional regulator, cyclic AMP receptor protein